MPCPCSLSGRRPVRRSTSVDWLFPSGSIPDSLAIKLGSIGNKGLQHPGIVIGELRQALCAKSSRDSGILRRKGKLSIDENSERPPLIMKQARANKSVYIPRKGVPYDSDNPETERIYHTPSREGFRTDECYISTEKGLCSFSTCAEGLSSSNVQDIELSTIQSEDEEDLVESESQTNQPQSSQNAPSMFSSPLSSPLSRMTPIVSLESQSCQSVLVDIADYYGWDRSLISTTVKCIVSILLLHGESGIEHCAQFLLSLSDQGFIPTMEAHRLLAALARDGVQSVCSTLMIWYSPKDLLPPIFDYQSLRDRRIRTTLRSS